MSPKTLDSEKRFFRKFRRIISCLAIITFLVQTVSYAAPVLQLQNGPKEFQAVPVEIEIPSRLGEIQCSHYPASDSGLIIQIQDAHGNPEAQRNIEKILSYLRAHYGIRQFFLEGSTGELRPEKFHFFKEVSWNLEVIDSLMKQGHSNGMEKFLLAESFFRKGETDGVRAHGIEDAGLYRKDIDLFRAVVGRGDEREEFFRGIHAALRDAEHRRLTGALRAFVRSWRRYEESDSKDILEFLKVLCKFSERFLSLDLKDPAWQDEYPSLVRILKMKELESSLDVLRVREEADALEGALKGKVNGKLLKAFRKLKAQTGTEAGENPRFLLEKLYESAKGGIDFRQYPNFSKWAARKSFWAEVNAQAVFDETEKLADAILSRLARGEEEKETILLIRDVWLTEKLLRLDLIRRDYDRLTADRESRTPSRLAERIGEFRGVKTGKLGLRAAGEMDSVFENAARFYGLAVKREEAFRERILEAMREGKRTGAAVLTGGFHAQGLETWAREAGISYVSIQPRITKAEQGSEIYLNAMMGVAPKIETSEAMPAGNFMPAGDFEAMWGAAAATVRARAIEDAKGAVLRRHQPELAGAVAASLGGVPEVPGLTGDEMPGERDEKNGPQFGMRIMAYAFYFDDPSGVEQIIAGDESFGLRDRFALLAILNRLNGKDDLSVTERKQIFALSAAALSQTPYRDLLADLSGMTGKALAGEMIKILEQKEKTVIAARGASLGEDWSEVEAFLKQIPLAEGHAHFGGSIHPEDLWSLALMRNDVRWDDLNVELSKIFGQPVDLNGLLSRARQVRKQLEEGKASASRQEELQSELQGLKNQFTHFTQYRPEKKGHLEDFVVVYEVAGRLSKGSPEIIEDVARRIALRNYKEGVRLLELRTSMPREQDEQKLIQLTLERLLATIRGLRAAENEVNTRLLNDEVGLETKIIVTIEKYHSMGTIAKQVQALLHILEYYSALYPELREYVVGFDVANAEQLKVPPHFVDVFRQVKDYNRRRGERGEPQLGLTYHVGEDFENTSIESAIRHVDEAIELGINRIGHGLVVGVDVSQFLGTERREHVSERLFQIYYDLKAAKFDAWRLGKAGLAIDTRRLKRELRGYRKKYKQVDGVIAPLIYSILRGASVDAAKERRLFSELLLMRDAPRYQGSFVTIRYDEDAVRNLAARQNYVLNRIAEREIVIEANPTSNVFIGPVASYGDHPLRRFLRHSFPNGTTASDGLVGKKPIVTINTDDSGIFGTSLFEEYVNIAKAARLSPEELRRAAVSAFKYRFSHFPLRFREQIRSALGPDVEKELAGYQIVETAFGKIQFTLPFETLRDLRGQLDSGKDFPVTFVLPPAFFRGGINYADLGSVLEFFAFTMRSGIRINLVLTQEQMDALKGYLEQTMFGVDFESADWQTFRKRWERALAQQRGLAPDAPEILGEISAVEASIRAAQNLSAAGSGKGRRRLSDFVNFIPFEENKVRVPMVDARRPGRVLGEVEIIRAERDEERFTVREVSYVAPSFPGQGYRPVEIPAPEERIIDVDYRRPYHVSGTIPQSVRELLAGELRPRFGYTVLDTGEAPGRGHRIPSFIVWVGGKGILVDPTFEALQKIELLNLTKDDVPYVLLTNNRLGKDSALLKWLFTGKKTTLLTSFPVYFDFLKRAETILGQDIEQAGYVDFVPLLDFMKNQLSLPDGEKVSIEIRHNPTHYPSIGFKIGYSRGRVSRVIGFPGSSQLSALRGSPDYLGVLREEGLRGRDLARVMSRFRYFFTDPDGNLKRNISIVTGRPMKTETILPSDGELRRNYFLQVVSLVSLLSEKSQKELQRILETGAIREFKPQEVMIEQGTYAREGSSDFIIILSGDAAVIQNGKVLAYVRKGTSVGELALVTGEKRGATVRAISKVTTLTLTADQFDRLIRTPEAEERIRRTRENIGFLEKMQQNPRPYNPFEPLGYNALAYLAARAEHRSFKAGSVILKQGDKAESVFIIKRGRVGGEKRIKRNGKTAREKFSLKEDDYFGEIALMTKEGVRTATISAETDVELLEIHRDFFESVRTLWPEFNRVIQATAERRDKNLPATKGASLGSNPGVTPIRVLMLDDDQSTRSAIELDLNDMGEVKGVAAAATREEALEAFTADAEVNFILVDFQLGNYDTDRSDNGVRFLRQAFETRDFTGAVVILSGEDSAVIAELQKYPDLWSRYQKGQISVQLKGADVGRLEESVKAFSMRGEYGEASAPGTSEKAAEGEESGEPAWGETFSFPPLEITPEESGIAPEITARYRDCHVIIADDKPFIQDTIRSVVGGFFDHIHTVGSVDEVLAQVKQLRAEGVPDEKIIVLCDYEFGSEQEGGARNRDGYDALHSLRMGPDAAYEGEKLDFRGPFIFVSGSVISKDQITGYDSEIRDIRPDVKNRYRFDYAQKEVDEKFHVELLRKIYRQLEEPFDFSAPILDAMPRRPMSKPADISFLNGGVSDAAARFSIFLRELKGLLEKAGNHLEDQGIVRQLNQYHAMLRDLLNFRNVDQGLPFNRRVHNYKGRIFAAAQLASRIERIIAGLGAEDRETFAEYSGELGHLRLAMETAGTYTKNLLRLSAVVGGVNRSVTFDEFLRNTTGAFIEDYGEEVTVESHFDRDAFSGIELPYGMIFVVTQILANALEQYRERKPEAVNPKIYFRMNEAQNEVWVEIEDEAGGIPPEILPRLFKRTFTTKKHGTGYGLYWAKRLMEMFGGSIEAENAGQGARFRLRLPLRWKEKVPAEEVPEKLAEKVFHALRAKGIPEADELAPVIAGEIRAYSQHAAHYARLMEVQEISQSGHQDDFEEMLKTFHEVMFYKNYRDSIWRLIFEMGVTQDEIESVLVSMLRATDDQTLKKNLEESLLKSQVSVVLAQSRWSSREPAGILVRSRANAEKGIEEVTPEAQVRFQRTLRLVGYMVHKMAGTGFLLWPMIKRLSASAETSEKLYRIFNEGQHSGYMWWVHANTSSDQQFTGFETDPLIVERAEGWLGAMRSHVEIYEKMLRELSNVEASQRDEAYEDLVRVLSGFYEDRRDLLLFCSEGKLVEEKRFFGVSEILGMGRFGSQVRHMDERGKFHADADPGLRLWGKEFFIDNIFLNIFWNAPKNEDFYIHAVEEQGQTVFRFTFKGAIDPETIFEVKEDRNAPWHRGALIRDLVEACGGTIEARNSGENVEITIRFPLPADVGASLGELAADDARALAKHFLGIDLMRSFGFPLSDDQKDARLRLGNYDVGKLISDFLALPADDRRYELTVIALMLNRSLLSYAKLRELYFDGRLQSQPGKRKDLINILRHIQFGVLMFSGEADGNNLTINRRTWEGRLEASFEVIDGELRRFRAGHPGEAMTIGDFGVSDGTGTYEMALRYREENVRVVGYDKVLNFIVRKKGNITCVYDPQGKILQLFVGPNLHEPTGEGSLEWLAGQLGMFFDYPETEETDTRIISLINPEAEEFARENPDRLAFAEHDVFQPLAPRHDFVRVAGLLMRGKYSYFSDEKIKSALSRIGNVLPEGGALLNGTFWDGGSQYDLFRREGNRLRLENSQGYWDFDGWEEIGLAAEASSLGQEEREGQSLGGEDQRRQKAQDYLEFLGADFSRPQPGRAPALLPLAMRRGPASPEETFEQFETRMVPKIQTLARTLKVAVGIHVMPARDMAGLLEDAFDGHVYVIEPELMRKAKIATNRAAAKNFLKGMLYVLGANTIGFGFKSAKGTPSVPLTLFIKHHSPEGYLQIIRSGTFSVSPHDPTGYFLKGEHSFLDSRWPVLFEDRLLGLIQWQFEEIDGRPGTSFEWKVIERYVDKLLEIAGHAAAEGASLGNQAFSDEEIAGLKFTWSRWVPVPAREKIAGLVRENRLGLDLAADAVTSIRVDYAGDEKSQLAEILHDDRQRHSYFSYTDREGTKYTYPAPYPRDTRNQKARFMIDRLGQMEEHREAAKDFAKLWRDPAQRNTTFPRLLQVYHSIMQTIAGRNLVSSREVQRYSIRIFRKKEPAIELELAFRPEARIQLLRADGTWRDVGMAASAAAEEDPLEVRIRQIEHELESERGYVAKYGKFAADIRKVTEKIKRLNVLFSDELDSDIVRLKEISSDFSGAILPVRKEIKKKLDEAITNLETSVPSSAIDPLEEAAGMLDGEANRLAGIIASLEIQLREKLGERELRRAGTTGDSGTSSAQSLGATETMLPVLLGAIAAGGLFYLHRKVAKRAEVKETPAQRLRRHRAAQQWQDMPIPAEGIKRMTAAQLDIMRQDDLRRTLLGENPRAREFENLKPEISFAWQRVWTTSLAVAGLIGIATALFYLADNVLLFLGAVSLAVFALVPEPEGKKESEGGTAYLHSEATEQKGASLGELENELEKHINEGRPFREPLLDLLAQKLADPRYVARTLKVLMPQAQIDDSSEIKVFIENIEPRGGSSRDLIPVRVEAGGQSYRIGFFAGQMPPIQLEMARKLTEAGSGPRVAGFVPVSGNSQYGILPAQWIYGRTLRQLLNDGDWELAYEALLIEELDAKRLPYRITDVRENLNNIMREEITGNVYVTDPGITEVPHKNDSLYEAFDRVKSGIADFNAGKARSLAGITLRVVRKYYEDNPPEAIRFLEAEIATFEQELIPFNFPGASLRHIFPQPFAFMETLKAGLEEMRRSASSLGEKSIEGGPVPGVTHDVRKNLAAKLDRALGGRYEIRHTTFSTIDIAHQNSGKGYAIRDFFSMGNYDLGLYFGDEFYKNSELTGNDHSIIEAKLDLEKRGKRLILFSVDTNPEMRSEEAKANTLWIGSGPEATRRVLAQILEALESGEKSVVIWGKGMDSNRSVEIDLRMLVRKGMVASDIDGTLFENWGEGFSSPTKMRNVFMKMLKRVPVAIISGNSRIEQKRRIGDPMIQLASAVSRLTLYLNEGTMRMRFDDSGREILEDILPKIPLEDIRTVQAVLREEAQENFGLSPEEVSAWLKWLSFNGEYGIRTDYFPNVHFIPWVRSGKQYNPAIVGIDRVRNALRRKRPLVITEPYIESHNAARLSVKFFPGELPLPSANSMGGGDREGISRRQVDMDGYDEIYFSIQPVRGETAVEQLEDCLGQVKAALAARGLNLSNVMTQNVFIRAEDDANHFTEKYAMQKVLEDFYGESMPPVNFIGQHPADGEKVTTEFIVLVPKKESVSIESKSYSRDGGTYHYKVVEQDGAKWVYAGGIQDETATGTYEASQASFVIMNGILQAEGLTFSDVVRQWNYIEDIVGLDGERQKYQIFNDVRASWYAAASFTNGYPAATGIGTSTGGVVLAFTAFGSARDDSKVVPIKNPQQIDAHRYTQEVLVGVAVDAQKQKATPKFERAKAVVDGGDVTLFISGTAGIRGQQTVAGGIEEQTEIMIENIEALISRENLEAHGIRAGATLRDVAQIRVYVKQPEHMEAVKKICSDRFPGIPALFLIADVCRPNLLVEMEGIAFTKTDSAASLGKYLYPELLVEMPYVEKPFKNELFRGADVFRLMIFSLPAIILSGIISAVLWVDLRGSGQSIIFRQERAGFKGKVFRAFKFRTMDENRNSTRFQKFLRRTGLDELPQLLNVLKGEMSISGPRPLPLEEVNKDYVRQVLFLRRPGFIDNLSAEMGPDRGSRTWTIEQEIEWALAEVETWKALGWRYIPVLTLKALRTIFKKIPRPQSEKNPAAGESAAMPGEASEQSEEITRLLSSIFGEIAADAPLEEAANAVFNHPRFGDIIEYIGTFENVRKVLPGFAGLHIAMPLVLAETRMLPAELDVRAKKIADDPELMALFQELGYQSMYKTKLQEALLVSDDAYRAVKSFLRKENGRRVLQEKRTGQAIAIFLSARKTREAACAFLEAMNPGEVGLADEKGLWLLTKESELLSQFWYFLAPVYERLKARGYDSEEAGERLVRFCRHYQDIQDVVWIPFGQYEWEDWIYEKTGSLEMNIDEPAIGAIVDKLEEIIAQSGSGDAMTAQSLGASDEPESARDQEGIERAIPGAVWDFGKLQAQFFRNLAEIEEFILLTGFSHPASMEPVPGFSFGSVSGETAFEWEGEDKHSVRFDPGRLLASGEERADEIWWDAYGEWYEEALAREFQHSYDHEPSYPYSPEDLAGMSGDILKKMKSAGVEFRGKSVLDIGTGSGIVGFAAAQDGASEIYGTDPCAGALDEARANARKMGLAVTYLPLSADQIDGVGRKFALVIERNVFKYLPPKLRARAIAKAFDRLEPGGELVLYENVRGLRTEWTRRQWREFMEQAGYDEGNVQMLSGYDPSILDNYNPMYSVSPDAYIVKIRKSERGASLGADEELEEIRVTAVRRVEEAYQEALGRIRSDWNRLRIERWREKTLGWVNQVVDQEKAESKGGRLSRIFRRWFGLDPASFVRQSMDDILPGYLEYFNEVAQGEISHGEPQETSAVLWPAAEAQVRALGEKYGTDVSGFLERLIGGMEQVLKPKRKMRLIRDTQRGLTHAAEITDWVLSAARDEHPDVDREVLIAGAWLHDVGKGSSQHESKAARKAGEILLLLGWPEDRVRKVQHVVMTHRWPRGEGGAPSTVEARLVRDFDKLFPVLGMRGLVESKENYSRALEVSDKFYDPSYFDGSDNQVAGRLKVLTGEGDTGSVSNDILNQILLKTVLLYGENAPVSDVGKKKFAEARVFETLIALISEKEPDAAIREEIFDTVDKTLEAYAGTFRESDRGFAQRILDDWRTALRETGVRASSLGTGLKATDVYGDFYRQIRESVLDISEITEADLARSRNFLGEDGKLKSREDRRSNGTFGITEVYFLSESETRIRMAAFQQVLKREFGDKIYLVNEDKLHFTSQGLEIQWEDQSASTTRELAMHQDLAAINPNQGALAEVRKRAREIPTRAVSMQVAKVNWNPSIGIFWELRPYLEEGEEDPIMSRRAAWNLPQPRPPHVTAAYFTQPFNSEEISRLRALIAQYQQPGYFGDIDVNELQVIGYEDYSFNAGYRVLKTVPLKPGTEETESVIRKLISDATALEIRRPVRTILVAEDDPRYRAVYEKGFELFADRNIRVIYAQDGKKAFDYLKEHPDEIDLLITDRGLPYIPGDFLMRDARSFSGRNIPVFFVSAADEFTSRQLEQHGNVIQLHKKYFSPETFAAVMKVILAADTGALGHGRSLGAEDERTEAIDLEDEARAYSKRTGRAEPEAVAAVAEQVTFRIYYVEGKTVAQFYKRKLGLTGEEALRAVSKAVRSFNGGILTEPILKKLGADPAGNPVPVIAYVDGFLTKETAEKFSQAMKPGDFFLAVWNGRLNRNKIPAAVEALFNARHFKTEALREELADTVGVTSRLGKFSEPPVIFSSTTREDGLELNLGRSELRIKFNVRELEENGIDLGQAIALVKQIADDPQNAARFLDEMGVSREGDCRIVGKNFARFIETFWNEYSAGEAVRIAA